jgi:hypothetical protein
MATIGELSIEHNVCVFCGAQRGERCKTASGKTAPEHVDRWLPLSNAWSDGYDTGLRDAVESPDFAARWAARR